MSYLVLARKYRPSNFEEVVGQEAVSRTLANAISLDRLAHAYLFAGSRGVGKTSIARILAKSLNCVDGPTPKPCGVCERCVAISKGQDIDVQEIDAASNRGIDHIRDLRENVRYAPVFGRFKVYIIDEVHQLTTESFNALLKTLEEPPRHVLFVFATTEAEKVPETVRSRCQTFEFRRLSEEQIANQLKAICDKEGVELEPGLARQVARRARGGLRDAQSLLDQLITMGNGSPTAQDLAQVLGSMDSGALGSLMDAILNEDANEILRLVRDACAGGASVPEILDQVMNYTRDLMSALVGDSSDFASDVESSVLMEQARRLDLDACLAMNQILQQGRARLREIDDPRLVLETVLLKLSRLRAQVDLGAALEYLRRSGSQPLAVSRTPKASSSRTVEVNKVARGETEIPKNQLDASPAAASPTRATPNLDSQEVSTVKRPESKEVSRKYQGDAATFFSALIEEIGKGSKSLSLFMQGRFRPVDLHDGVFEVRDTKVRQERLYDLSKGGDRDLVVRSLEKVYGSLCRWKEVEGSSDDTKTSVESDLPDVVQKAKQIFDGDVVSE